MRSLAVLLIIPFALCAQPRQIAGQITGVQPGQQRAMPPPSPPQDLCTFEGQAMDASSGEPLRKVNISMNGMHSYGGTTDATGKFSITGIEPGSYRVNASRTGYLSTQYNARRPDGPGTSLDLARAQKVSGAVFHLMPHGVITGKMVDEDEDPLQNVQIQLMRLVYVRGHKQLQQYNGNQTNDLGEYRIFGVQPGKYYLCATYRGGRFNVVMMAGGMNVTNTGSTQPQEDYVPTFYPGVTDIAAAMPIDMKPGQQLQGINLKLTKIHTVSVKGTVVNNTVAAQPEPAAGGRGGVRINNVNLTLEPRNSLNPNGLAQGTGLRPDGAFEFPSVAPGSYNLIATSNAGNIRHATMMPIEVGNTNLEGVSVSINPGVAVSGHIRIDGDTTDPIPSFMIRLAPWSPGGNFIAVPQPAKIDASNNFSFDDVNPEHFEVNVTPLTGTFYIKSIRAGNADVLNGGLDLTSGSGATVDVVIGVNAPQITGTVQDPATQQPAMAATVVLIPQEKERQETAIYYRTASTDQSGNFTFSRVNPGEYRVYSWDQIENGEWFDPDFIKPVESKGAAVSVREGTPSTVQVTMIQSASGN